MSRPALPPVENRQAVGVILGVSALVLAFLFYLIYWQGPQETQTGWTTTLPGFNALCNAISATCVALGVYCIKTGRKRAHGAMMIAALIASAAFLVGYIIYHQTHGDTRFLREDWLRPVYFFILVSHIVLSMVVVPLVLCSAYFAAARRWRAHRRVGRWTYPVWLYVSVTGVLVFVFLRLLNPVVL